MEVGHCLGKVWREEEEEEEGEEEEKEIHQGWLRRLRWSEEEEEEKEVERDGNNLGCRPMGGIH